MIITHNGIVAKAETPADVERINRICNLLDDFHRTVFTPDGIEDGVEDGVCEHGYARGCKACNPDGPRGDTDDHA